MAILSGILIYKTKEVKAWKIERLVREKKSTGLTRSSSQWKSDIVPTELKWTYKIKPYASQ